MDGVLVNFADGALKANRIDIRHDDIKKYDFFEDFGLNKTEFFRNIDKNPNFWEKLDPYPWYKNLLQVIKSTFTKKIILWSSSANSRYATKGKYNWICKYLPEYKKSYIFSPIKHLAIRFV